MSNCLLVRFSTNVFPKVSSLLSIGVCVEDEELEAASDISSISFTGLPHLCNAIGASLSPFDMHI